ncbi:hypothetical protein B0H65DRAFT_414735 [Neurospora tetraspora]|uniref:Uncharacterized protein n=1 Tax=Neurospora tetraspora TaxID=94610 RepID=A0AAE0JQX1_9PEZI|nr:hypothetical protein B0H65DRAFT_414735 [Neurospora tetraspora]
MASRRASLSPPERQGTMDPGAHELPGSDTEDHYSDAISSPKAPSSPIPRTRVERVDDKPAYGEVPGTKAYALREGDAKPDEFAIIPDPDSKLSTEEHDERRPSTPGGRPIPKTVVEETPDSTGAVTHPEIEARHRVDSPPDVLVKADGQKIENEKGGDNDTPIPPALKSPASIHSRDSSSDLDQPSSELPSLGPSLLEKEQGTSEEANDDAYDDVVQHNAKNADEAADENEFKEVEDVEVKTEQAKDGEAEDEKHEEEQSKDGDTTEEEGPKADEFEDASEEPENQDTKKEDSEDQFDEPEPSQEVENKVEPEDDKKDGASFDSFDHKEEKPVENDGFDDNGFAEAGDKAPDDDGFGDDDFGDDFAEPAQAGGDDFGDDFDDFEEGAETNNDADFGDFDDAGFDDDDFQEAEGFSAPAPAPEPQPQQPQSSLSFQIPDFTHLSLSEILSLTSPYLNALFPPSSDTDGDDSNSIPTLNVTSNGSADPIFQHPRSASLWSQLVAPPPLQPPDWIRSRIRRLFLVSLGVPVDLDEILPASKQKKLVLPSLDRRGSSAEAEGDDGGRAGRSRRPSAALRSGQAQSVDSRGNPSSRTPSKQPPVNKTVAAATGSANRSSSSARKGPPPEPVFDLVAAKQLCETTDEALSGMTVKELKEHVQKLYAMQEVAKEVLVYWQQRTDEKIGDREAFEGVIENLVKHARKVRK